MREGWIIVWLIKLCILRWTFSCALFPISCRPENRTGGFFIGNCYIFWTTNINQVTCPVFGNCAWQLNCKIIKYIKSSWTTTQLNTINRCINFFFGSSGPSCLPNNWNKFYRQRIPKDHIKNSFMIHRITHLMQIMLLTLCSTNSHVKIHDSSNYLALMNNGIAVGRELQLSPGVALSVEQIGSLANDIVWFVERDVTLPNGSGALMTWPSKLVHSVKRLFLKNSSQISVFIF